MAGLLKGWGVSTQRLASLDLLSFNRAENAVAVLVIAAGFSVLDVLLQLTARPLAARLLTPPAGAAAKVPPKRGDVTKALLMTLSFLHLAVQIPLGLAVLADARLAADPVWGVSFASQLMVTVSSGYFLYDLAVCLLRFETEGPAFLVHALACLFVYGYAVFYGTLHWFGAAFLMWELSTPFVNIRWLLSASGRAHTRAYVLNGLAMAAVFFLCRNVWGVYCSVKFFAATQAELDGTPGPRPGGGFSPAGVWGYRAANVALNALNALWFWKIASGAARLLSGKPGKAKAAGKAT